MAGQRRDSVEERNKRLKLVTPKRNWKRHESVIRRRYRGALLRTSRMSEYKVYKPIEVEGLPTHETAVNKSANVLGWLESMIKRGRSALSSLKEDEKAFDVELQEEARLNFAREKLIQTALDESSEARDSSAANGYGTDTSFKNFNSTLRNSLADSLDGSDLNEALYANGSEMEGLESGDDRLSRPLKNSSVPASSFSIFQDEGNGDLVKQWNSASEASFDASEEDTREQGDSANVRNEDVIELLSSEDEENPSIEFEDQESHGGQWEDTHDFDSEGEESTGDIPADSEEQENRDYFGESQMEEKDSDVEYQSVSSADNSSRDEYNVDQLEIGEQEELRNQDEEFDYQEDEREEPSISAADQITTVTDESGEQRMSNSHSQLRDQDMLSEGSKYLAENPPNNEPSIILVETDRDKKPQINFGDPNSLPSVIEDGVTVKEVSDIPLSTSKPGKHVESQIISEANEDDSCLTPEHSDDLDKHKDYLKEDSCDYQAIANAVMNPPPLASNSLCLDNNTKVETDNSGADISRDEKANTSFTKQSDLDDEFEFKNTSILHAPIDASAPTVIAGTKDEEEENSGHQQFSTDVSQENSSLLQEEPSIYHSFAIEQTNIDLVNQTPQKNKELDPRYKLVFTGSAYSSSSYDKSDNIPEGEPDYVSPLAEDPFLSVGVEQSKVLLKKTLAALEEKNGSSKVKVDISSHMREGHDKTYDFSEEEIRSISRAPNEVFKDQDGKDRGSSVIREDYTTYPGDMKLPDGLQTRGSSVTYLSNAVAARDETLSVVHNKSVSQYNGHALPPREELGNLSHLKDEEISEYLSAVLEASGRIEDGMTLKTPSTNLYVEEVQFPDIESNSLVQTEPVIELNDTSADKLSDMVASRESCQHELNIVEEISDFNAIATTSADEAVEIIQTKPIIEEPFTSIESWPNGLSGETQRDVQGVHLSDDPNFADLRKRTYSMLDDDASAIETLESRRLSTTEWFAKVSNNSVDTHSSNVKRKGSTPPFEAVKLNPDEQSVEKHGSFASLRNNEDYAAETLSQRHTSTLLGHITSGLFPKKLISSPARAISSIVTGMKEVGTVASSFVKSLDVMDLDDDPNTQTTSDEADDNKSLEDKSPGSSDSEHGGSRGGNDLTEAEGINYMVEDVQVLSDTSEADIATSSVEDQTVLLKKHQQDPLAQPHTIHDNQMGVSSAVINQRISDSNSENKDESEDYLEKPLVNRSFDVKDSHEALISDCKSLDTRGNSLKGDEVSKGLSKSFITDEKEGQGSKIYVETESSSESHHGFVASDEPSELPKATILQGLVHDKGLENAAQVAATAENGFKPERHEVLSKVLALQELAEKLRNVHSVHSDVEEFGSLLPPDDSQGTCAPVNIEVDPEIHIEVNQKLNESSDADVRTIKGKDTFPIESTLVLESQPLKEDITSGLESPQSEYLSPEKETLTDPDTNSTTAYAGRTLPANLPSDPPSDNSEDHSQSEQESVAKTKVTGEVKSKTEEASPSPEYFVLDTTSDEGEEREIPVEYESKPEKAVSVTVEDKDPIDTVIHTDMEIKTLPPQNDTSPPLLDNKDKEQGSLTLFPGSGSRYMEEGKDFENKEESLNDRQLARKRVNKRSRKKRKAKLRASRANKKLNQAKSQRSRK